MWLCPFSLLNYNAEFKMFLIKNNFNFSLELRHTLLIGLKATVNEVHVYHKHLFSFLMQKFQFMLPQKCFFLQCKFFFYILKTCSNSSNTIEDPHLKSSTYTFAFKLEWYAQLHLYRLMSWFKKSVQGIALTAIMATLVTSNMATYIHPI